MKFFIYGFIVFLVLIPTISVHAALDPVAHWKFDESVAGSNAEDSIGTNDGTPTNSPIPSTDVPPVDFDDPYSASFDGSNYFTFTRPVSTDFSICAWVKTSSTGGGANHWQSAPIFDSESGGVDYDFGFGIGNGGKLMFGNGGIVPGQGLVDRQINGTTTINNNQWHNVCVTRNNTTGAVKLYVDAHLDGQGTTGTGALTRNPNFRTAYGYDGAALYVGKIDDLRVYDVVLTDEQLTNITAGSNDPDTPVDEDAPVISDVSVSSQNSSGATITWTTDEAASTKLRYSVDTSYTSSTTEIDTATRVTSHSQQITGLNACTTYSVKAVSADAAGNTTTGSGVTFTTTGCAADVAPTGIESAVIAVGSQVTTSLSSSSRMLQVTTPADFTASASSIVIQIKSLTASTVLDSIGKPNNGLSRGASIVFDVKALIDNTTELDSFDVPVTVTYTYTDTDVENLDERSLSMYHYANGSWDELDDCSVDRDANTISCTAPHFSVFAIFGTTPTLSAGVHSGVHFGCKDPSATNYEYFAASKPELCVYETPKSSVRNLQVRMTGEDVQMLQKFLNAQGYTLASSGPGAPGNETQLFGAFTRKALAKFQSDHKVSPSIGYFGPLTRAKIQELGLTGIWW